MPTLNWLTRDEDIRAAAATPYRLLEEVAELGHGDRDAGNMLIQGDNLDALKALLPFYAGQVKCISTPLLIQGKPSIITTTISSIQFGWG
jgi:adenine-specific DNA-methyltransferase